MDFMEMYAQKKMTAEQAASLVKSGDEFYVMATDLVDAAMADRGTTDYDTVGVIQGSELEYMKTQHPFIDRTSLVIVGDHVTLESGTGCVHTAPVPLSSVT